MQKILIKSFTNLNRAFDGDTVIVELLDKSKWETPSSKLPGDDVHGAVSIAPVRLYPCCSCSANISTTAPQLALQRENMHFLCPLT